MPGGEEFKGFALFRSVIDKGDCVVRVGCFFKERLHAPFQERRFVAGEDDDFNGWWFCGQVVTHAVHARSFGSGFSVCGNPHTLQMFIKRLQCGQVSAGVLFDETRMAEHFWNVPYRCRIGQFDESQHEVIIIGAFTLFSEPSDGLDQRCFADDEVGGRVLAEKKGVIKIRFKPGVAPISPGIKLIFICIEERCAGMVYDLPRYPVERIGRKQIILIEQGDKVTCSHVKSCIAACLKRAGFFSAAVFYSAITSSMFFYQGLHFFVG